MDIATIVFMVIGLLLVAFAAVAVISSIRGVSHIKAGSFQEKLAIVNES